MNDPHNVLNEIVAATRSGKTCHVRNLGYVMHASPMADAGGNTVLDRATTEAYLNAPVPDVVHVFGEDGVFVQFIAAAAAPDEEYQQAMVTQARINQSFADPAWQGFFNDNPAAVAYDHLVNHAHQFLNWVVVMAKIDVPVSIEEPTVETVTQADDPVQSGLDVAAEITGEVAPQVGETTDHAAPLASGQPDMGLRGIKGKVMEYLNSDTSVVSDAKTIAAAIEEKDTSVSSAMSALSKLGYVLVTKEPKTPPKFQSAKSLPVIPADVMDTINTIIANGGGMYRTDTGVIEVKQW